MVIRMMYEWNVRAPMNKGSQHAGELNNPESARVWKNDLVCKPFPMIVKCLPAIIFCERRCCLDGGLCSPQWSFEHLFLMCVHACGFHVLVSSVVAPGMFWKGWGWTSLRHFHISSFPSPWFPRIISIQPVLACCPLHLSLYPLWCMSMT